jgi:hypothetical protein
MQVVEGQENQQTAQEFKLHFINWQDDSSSNSNSSSYLLTPESPSSSVLITQRTSQRGGKRIL